MWTKDFEVVDHTADWALLVRGESLEQLLINAAQGMATLLVAELNEVPLDEAHSLELYAFDAESLLVAWLTELAYLAETEQLVFRNFRLTAVSPTHLKASIRGGLAPELQKHIKAVTYHNLAIIKTESGLETTIVFDV
jgi:SHS2 domain-containing protein